MKIINFLKCSENVQNALKDEIKQYIFFHHYLLTVSYLILGGVPGRVLEGELL